MTDFKLDPANYVMKGNKPIDGLQPRAPHNKTGAEVLGELGIDWNDDAAVKALARKELVTLLATPSLQPTIKVSIIRELFDRLDGKATQRIEQKLEVNSKHVAVELSSADLIAELNRLGMSTQHLVSNSKDKAPITIDQ